MLAEPGETLEGHPTRHYKVRISYSMHFLKQCRRYGRHQPRSHTPLAGYRQTCSPGLKTDARRSYVEYQELSMASDIEQQGSSNLLIYFRLPATHASTAHGSGN